MARKPDVQYIRFVTDGSSARVAEPARHTAATRLPKRRRATSLVIRLDPLAFTGIAVSAVMMVLMVVSCIQLSALQTKTDEMSRYVDTLMSENARLTDMFQQKCDLEDVEEKALALGMIPVDQAQRIQVSVPAAEGGEEASKDSHGWAFLTGIFD